MLTELQKELSAFVEGLLSDRTIPYKFDTFPVKKQYSLTPVRDEVYVRYEFSFKEHVYEVFIYSDEAGFYRDKRWIVFERGAYSRVQELIRAFVDRISEEVMGAHREE